MRPAWRSHLAEVNWQWHYLRVHDLRRTAATRMAELGINPHTIGMVLNHVSGSKSTIMGAFTFNIVSIAKKREALQVYRACL